MKKIALSVFIALVLCIGYLPAVTRVVKQDGTGDYTVVQLALNAAVQGDTVLVYPGSYYERLTMNTAGVSLIGLEAVTNDSHYIDTTIIDANNQGCALLTGHRTGLHVRGLSFTKSLGPGIGVIDHAEISIVNCKIFGNKSRGHAGGLGINGATVFLSGVEITENYAYTSGGGLFIGQNTGDVNHITFDPVNRCSIYNNSASNGQDIYIFDARTSYNIPLAKFTVMQATNYFAVIQPDYDCDCSLTIVPQTAYMTEIDHDIWVSPTGNDDDDGLSPDSALRTIHLAIHRIASDSVNTNTVHLLPGTYSRAENQQILSIALKSWVNVVGSGRDVTILEGSPYPGASYAYASARVFSSYGEKGWSVQSMSITSDWFEGSCAIGGYYESRVLLKDLHIYHFRPNNESVLSFYGLDESLWENVIVENVVTDDGGMVEVGRFSRGTLRNVTVRNGLNTFVSDEIWAWPLFSIMMDDWISFENCSFINLAMTHEDSNLMQVGGMQYPAQHNRISFVNCLFSDLVSYSDMIVIGSSNQPIIDITNCTIAGNSSWYYTMMLNGTVNITNSIFFNDCLREILPNLYFIEPETSIFNVSYSTFREGQTSISHTYGSTINYDETNSDLDPLFWGPQQQDLPPVYLGSGSSCIDSGNPVTDDLGLLPYDLAGNRRIWNGRIDRGCYEYGSETWVEVDDQVVPEIPVSSMSIYPNPFSNLSFIKLELGHLQKVKKVNEVKVSVYNLRGQRVWSQALNPVGRSTQVLYWDGRDLNGDNCANGIYFISLSVNGKVQESRKVTKIVR